MAQINMNRGAPWCLAPAWHHVFAEVNQLGSTERLQVSRWIFPTIQQLLNKGCSEFWIQPIQDISIK